LLIILNCFPCLSIRPTNDFNTTINIGGYTNRIKILGIYEPSNDELSSIKVNDCKNIMSRYINILHENGKGNDVHLLHPAHLVNCKCCLFRSKFYENAGK